MADTLQTVEVTPGLADLPVDELDRKLLEAFAGRVVRKDLVKKLKVGFNVPVYVLEYLLGKYLLDDRPQPDRGRPTARLRKRLSNEWSVPTRAN